MKKQTSALIAAGAGIAAAATFAVVGSSMATAEDATSSATSTAAPTASGSTSDDQGAPNGNTDPSKPMRSDEELLTGDTAEKVTAAVKAEEPDATIERVETDSDGVYEAHMVRADGTHITVLVDKDFKVTDVLVGGPGGRGPGGPGHGPDDSDAGSSDSGSSATQSST